MNGNSEDYIERFLAMSNPMFGVGIVAFFLFPNKWSVVKSPEAPECLNLRDVGNHLWVANGSMRTALIVREGGGHRTYFFQLFVKSFFEDEKAERHVLKQLAKVHRNKRVELVRDGDIPAGGHQGMYALWTRRRKRLLIGKDRREAVLYFFVYCDVTKRLLHLKLSTLKPESMLMDVEKLISMLSSIGCHSRALKSE